jgi:hypothetical protein
MARATSVKQFKTRAPSGQDMTKELQARLPAIKAKVRERTDKLLMGRPTTYKPEIGESICALMAEGNSLTDACDKLGILRGTVHGWAERNPDFAATLARAREALAEHAFSEAYAIPKKLLALYDANPELKLDPARVQAARLATDTLKWYSERLKPRTFGEKKIEQSVTITNNALTIDSRELSQDQRDALRGALLAAKSLPVTIDHD